jgi:hypothetical protein
MRDAPVFHKVNIVECQGERLAARESYERWLGFRRFIARGGSRRSDDVLDGAVTDAGVEPVVVVRDIGEGVHACGGFFGQLVDLGFDVFGGLFGGKLHARSASVGLRSGPPGPGRPPGGMDWPHPL